MKNLSIIEYEPCYLKRGFNAYAISTGPCQPAWPGEKLFATDQFSNAEAQVYLII